MFDSCLNKGYKQALEETAYRYETCCNNKKQQHNTLLVTRYPSDPNSRHDRKVVSKKEVKKKKMARLGVK
jgi:hypothetical protein